MKAKFVVCAIALVGCAGQPEGPVELHVDCPDWTHVTIEAVTEHQSADVRLAFDGGEDVVCFEPGDEAPDALIPIELEPNEFDRRNPVYRQMTEGLKALGLAQ